MVTGHVATVSKAGFTSVEIEVEKVEHNLDNQLTILPVPNKGQNDTKTYVVDLARLKETVTITGCLLDESASSAQTKKANLLSIMRDDSKTTRLVRVIWGDATASSPESTGDNLSGSIVKCSIIESPGRLTNSAGTLGTDTRIFNINIQFTRGTPKGK